MTEQHMKALFLLAGFEIKQHWELANQYWPNFPEYFDIRKAHPWWLVHTPQGMVTIGWRKRVISIDWSDTGVLLNNPHITADSVTVDGTGVHAWSYVKAVEYLTELRQRLVAERNRVPTAEVAQEP